MKPFVNDQNVAAYHKFAKTFKLVNFTKATLRYIERCFTRIADTQNFLELDFTFIKFFFSSSNLKVDSEIEVIEAADAWVRYNSKERVGFAKDLLLKLRLPLLSDNALSYVRRKFSIFDKNEISSLKETSQNKTKYYLNKSAMYHTNRCCAHGEFNLLIIGGEFGEKKIVNRIDRKGQVTPLGVVVEEREVFSMVCSKDDVYLFGHSNQHSRSVTVKKYLPLADKWQELAELDFGNRVYFGLCAFMEKIYLVAGWIFSSDEDVTECIEYDTRDHEWKKIAEVSLARSHTECTVFGGKVVACGGLSTNMEQFKIVEAYDHVTDEWSRMPDMIDGRCEHKAIAVGNKLFAFGGNILPTKKGVDSSEVYDSYCNKFVLLQTPQRSSRSIIYLTQDVVLMGRKILFFINESSFMVVYDVERNEWSENPCKVTTELCDNYSCVRISSKF